MKYFKLSAWVFLLFFLQIITDIFVPNSK